MAAKEPRNEPVNHAPFAPRLKGQQRIARDPDTFIVRHANAGVHPTVMAHGECVPGCEAQNIERSRGYKSPHDHFVYGPADLVVGQLAAIWGINISTMTNWCHLWAEEKKARLAALAIEHGGTLDTPTMLSRREHYVQKHLDDLDEQIRVQHEQYLDVHTEDTNLVAAGPPGRPGRPGRPKRRNPSEVGEAGADEESDEPAGEPAITVRQRRKSSASRRQDVAALLELQAAQRVILGQPNKITAQSSHHVTERVQVKESIINTPADAGPEAEFEAVEIDPDEYIEGEIDEGGPGADTADGADTDDEDLATDAG